MSTWSVVLLDSKPIRQKAQRDYQKAARDLDTAKAEAERFHSEDQPLFMQWLNGNFGALLTDIRELQGTLFEAQNLVNEVQQEYHFGDHPSIASAYRHVLHRRAHPDEEEAEEEIEAEEAKETRDSFEEVFGKMAEEFWENFGKGSGVLGAAARVPSPQSMQRLKEIYRKLARRLHPDNGHTITAKEKELWHETQSAYEERNIDRLEMILTLLEVDDKGTKTAAVSTLLQLTADFKKSLRALKRQLAKFRQDVAWNFSRREDRTELFCRTDANLRADREKVLWLLEKYQAQIRRWETQAAVNGRRARSRRRVPIDEEWF